MREIKFRGKNVDNNEWMYGFLTKCQNRIWENGQSSQDGYKLQIISHEMPIGVWDVIPETVGQYTGLKDKNGVEIYEGKNSVKIIIKGCGEGLADIVMHEGKWCVFEQSQGFAPLFELLNGNSTEIHSNPELLK